MCTLIVTSRVFGDAPLVVAANRDERLDRPSEPPALRALSGRTLLMPLDLQGGGSWLGVNSAGVFAGLTNRFGLPPDPARRSRGSLVPLALQSDTAGEAFRRLRAVEPGAFNRFHLVVADRREAFLVWSDGQDLHPEALPAGVHVITERSLQGGETPRERLLLERVRSLPRDRAPDGAVWRDLLTRHADDPFAGSCVHLPGMAYGTRSSTLLWLRRTGRDALWHAEGPPCRTPYRDLSGMLEGFPSASRTP